MSVVSDWIDAHHLKARVVYYRVPDPARESEVRQGLGRIGTRIELEQERVSFAVIEQALASRDLPC